MKDCEGVQDFCNIVTEIVNRIKGCGDTTKDKKVNQKVLRSLHSKFDPTKQPLKNQGIYLR